MVSYCHDAGAARLDHHHANLLPQPHLGQPVNDLRRAIHLDDVADFTSRHQLKGDDVFQGQAPKRERDSRQLDRNDYGER